MVLFFLQYQTTLEYGIVRDIVLLMRFLTIIVSFYLAYSASIRIREAGIISGTTGISLYMIGSGIFQLGMTVILIYADWALSDNFFLITNYAYLSTMLVFIIFTEMEQQKKFPIKSGEGYPFKLSLIAILIMIVSILMVSFIAIAMFNLAFILMTIPFMLTSINFIARYRKLEMLRGNSPVIWFGVGLAVAGFSNFILTFEIDLAFLVFIQSTMVIAGTLMVSKGWSLVPPLSELRWYLNLNRLIVIQRSSSLVLHSYYFQSGGEEDTSKDAESILAGGALSGVQSILTEILKTQGGIKVIDHGDKSIYFHHNEECTFVLFTSGKAEELSERLVLFSLKFMNKYGESLVNWNNNLEIFKDAKELVKIVFTH